MQPKRPCSCEQGHFGYAVVEVAAGCYEVLAACWPCGLMVTVSVAVTRLLAEETAAAGGAALTGWLAAGT